MTHDGNIDEVVHRHARAIVSMDIARIMDDMESEAMLKLQQQAGGGMAVQISAYQVLDCTPQDEDYVYDVKYVGPDSFTVRARWSRLGAGWKIVDADIIARE